jgi:aminomethyltransferase
MILPARRPDGPVQASPLNPRHVAAGARLSERPEAPGHDTPLSFGDVPAEYRAARTACALLDASDRGRVTVHGRDAADFLHRLLANKVRSLTPGRGNRNLLLSSRGKVVHAFQLARDERGFELSTPPGQESSLRAALDGYLFSERLTLEASGAEHAPLELCGPAAGAVLARLLGASLELEMHETRRLPWGGGELAITALPVAGSRGLSLDAGPKGVQALWEALCAAGARPAGLAARDSLRVEAGFALPGVDVDENVYPQEARLEDAFALDKGCYVGQEVVAKIDTYGGLNKRLEALRVGHDDPVPRGTLLIGRDLGGERRELGLVTSWAYSFELDCGLALAYVKRRHQEPGSVFELEPGGGRATLVALPLRADALCGAQRGASTGLKSGGVPE